MRKIHRHAGLSPIPSSPHPLILFCRAVYIALFIIGLFLSCAQEGAPPGGPPDTFPPYIVSTDPPTGTINVSRTISPVLTFSERMDPRTVEESIFIAPVVPFDLKTNWGGNEITLRFKRPLDEARTYVITIGTGARDMRNNRLSGSVVLAISTGPTIDDGEISGTVVTGIQPVIGAFVWAYNLRTTPEPDPAITPPDYIVQTGEGGRYTFSSLSPGPYRLFAFLDRGRDRRYDPGQDPLGVPTSDIILASEQAGVQDRRMELAIRDTTAFMLLSVRPMDTTHLRLRFTRPIASDPADSSAYGIRDQADDTALSVLAAYQDPADSASVLLLTAPQTPQREYTLSVTNLRDRMGRPLDPAETSVWFTGGDTPDRDPPIIRHSVPADSAVNVPLRSGIRLVFSEAVQADSGAVILQDFSGRMVDSAMILEDPAMVRLQPDSTLQANTGYQIVLHTPRIRDRAENPMNGRSGAPDTLVIRFTTVDPSIYGSISGMVSDEDSSGTGAIAITAISVSDQRSRYETVIPIPGAYRIDDALPGSYAVSAYRDANGDGRLSLGSAIPFAPAERTTARMDTLVVRSGWESEQVDLRFPR